MTEHLSCPNCGAAIDATSHDARVSREAEEAALTVDRVAAALQIGWPGSRPQRQAYFRALAAALRVALLAPKQPGAE